MRIFNVSRWEQIKNNFYYRGYRCVAKDTRKNEALSHCPARRRQTGPSRRRKRAVIRVSASTTRRCSPAARTGSSSRQYSFATGPRIWSHATVTLILKIGVKQTMPSFCSHTFSHLYITRVVSMERVFYFSRVSVSRICSIYVRTYFRYTTHVFHVTREFRDLNARDHTRFFFLINLFNHLHGSSEKKLISHGQVKLFSESFELEKWFVV